MDWYLRALGRSEGTVSIGNKEMGILAGKERVCIGNLQEVGSVSISSRTGKMSDSEDSFLYCYVIIDPQRENIEVNASFLVEKSDRAGWQSGYGIVALDTDTCPSDKARYRNQVGVGRFRTKEAQKIRGGMKVVSGYEDSNAEGVDEQRVQDTSREAEKVSFGDRIREGERLDLSFRKTDKGYQGTICKDGVTEGFEIPGCDVLMKQSVSEIAVGFAVSGNLDIRVDNITVDIAPGKSSCTPEDAVRASEVDYPFSRETFARNPVQTRRYFGNKAIYASPTGDRAGAGTKEDPVDIETAFYAKDDDIVILLKGGTYLLQRSLYIPRENSGRRGHRRTVRPAEKERSVLDGSGIGTGTPAVVLAGDRWHICGIEVKNGPSVGIYLCGSGNILERCVTHHNGDTGILICGYPGSSRAEWPRNNKILFCDSYDNSDYARENADGFGAKLRIGKGNLFYECIAHNNVDDGFDLYAKAAYGGTEPVKILNSVACWNGHLSGEDLREGEGRGVGFKLGGEGQSCRHEVCNCIAYGNGTAGFSTNTNPSAYWSDLTAYGNGADLHCDFRLTTSRGKEDTDWEVTGLYPENILYRRTREGSDSPELSEKELAKLSVDLDRSSIPGRRADGTIDPKGLQQPWCKCKGAHLWGDDLVSVVKRRKFRRELTLDEKGTDLMFVVPKLSGGGAEKVIAAVASELSQEQNVVLVTTMREDSAEAYRVADGVQVINLYGKEGAFSEKKSPTQDEGSTSVWIKIQRKVKRIAKRAIEKIRRSIPAKFARDVDSPEVQYQIRRLRQLKKEHGIDCCISFLNSANYLNVMSDAGEKKIISVRSYLGGPYAPKEVYSERGRRWLREACRRADRIVSVSEEAKMGIVRDLDAPEKNIEVIYNYIDPDSVRSLAKEELPDEIGQKMKKAEFVFVNTGRLTEKKGQWHLVRAFRKVVEKHPGALLLILGRPGKGTEDTWDLVEKNISALGLENNVLMVGFDRNPFKYLAKADGYVMTSFNEGFPNALIEAMALSLPVISTDCSSGPREILAPGTDPQVKTAEEDLAEYGILVPMCSGEKNIEGALETQEEILTSAMLRLIEDGGLREHYSRQSAERVKDFDKVSTLQRWREVVGQTGRDRERF